MQSFGSSPIIGTGLIGKIDEVHVRSNAPTSFNPDTVDQTDDGNTLGLWHFDEGTGTSVADDDTGGQTQAATLPSSGVWSNAQNEGKPAIYLIKYEYD